MEAFLKFYDGFGIRSDFSLTIYHSSVMDWCIAVRYKITHPKEGKSIIDVQHCDVELAFAKAQVELKEWLLENEGGY